MSGIPVVVCLVQQCLQLAKLDGIPFGVRLVRGCLEFSKPRNSWHSCWGLLSPQIIGNGAIKECLHSC